jgi:hypothetical protein
MPRIRSAPAIAVGLAGIPALRAAWRILRGLSWLNAIFGWVLGYFEAGLFFAPYQFALPDRSSRSTAINPYRIAFFGKRGLASANKAGQQHYVVPDAP